MTTNTESADSTASEGVLESLLGNPSKDGGALKKLLTYPMSVRTTFAASAFAALLFIPYLGAVGLWDCWETHYGEVAREMIQRRDYVHPYWENAWFFSKPPLTMWLHALGMNISGTDIAAGPAELGHYTEWGFRMPSALYSILAIALLTWAITRTVNGRAALATAFVLTTMPLYFLLARQSVTDPPVVSSLVCALACAIVALYDKGTRHRSLWWYGFYGFCALGTFAKGLLGVGIPGVILILVAVLTIVPWNEKALEEHARWLVHRALSPLVSAGAAALLVWALTRAITSNNYYGITPALFVFAGGAAFFFRQLAAKMEAAKETVPVLWAKFYEMRLATGVFFFFCLVVPWFHRMFVFESVDDEGKLFWFRFLIHDHFARLGAGVHTTTPGGGFTYFLEQGGYAIYPWVVLIPGAAAVLARLKFRGEEPVNQVATVAVLWVAFTFALLGASATKFHHYVFPMLPPLAILMGLFIDKLWSEGIEKHGLPVALGVPLLFLVGKDLAANPKNFTDLFVYNYDRPYPVELVTRNVSFWTNRGLWSGDVLAFGAVLAGLLLLITVKLPSGPATAGGSKLAGVSFVSKLGGQLYASLVGLFLLGLGMGVWSTIASGGRVMLITVLGVFMMAMGVLATLGALAKEPSNQYVKWVLGAGAGLAGLGLVAASIYLHVDAAKKGIPATNPIDPLWPQLSEPASVKSVLGSAFGMFGVACAFLALTKKKTALFGTAVLGVSLFAFWFNWSHWVDLSHHWTQRDQFWRYYQQRNPNEPITAFLMNWRGETFYSRNTVKQIKDNALLYQYAQQPGREWALVEHNRLGILKGAVGPDKVVTLIDKDLNNKFVLVTIE